MAYINLQATNSDITWDVASNKNVFQISIASLPYLILFLLFILIYGPLLTIIAIGKFIGAHELYMTKIFCSLGNNASDFSRNKEVNL